MVSRSRSRSRSRNRSRKINLRSLFLTESERRKSRSRSGSKSSKSSKSNPTSSFGRINAIMNIDSDEKALEQINAIKSGSKMYTIHKADWCGYCVQLMEKLNKLMKEFNKAGKKITIQISTVNDDKLEMYNGIRTKNGLSPVEAVSSYPTIIREQKVGPSNQTTAERVGQDQLIETVNSTVTENPSSMTSGTPMSMTTEGSLVEEKEEETPNSITPIAASSSSTVPPIDPPSFEADEIVVAKNGNSNNSNQKSVQNGGYGLYPAIASTAYHLAPAGILLATAAATFKCRKGKGRRNRSRKGKGRR